MILRGESCEVCGAVDLTWADLRFGHCQRKAPAVSTASFDRRSGYQPTLARFRGDPEAVVQTPLGLKKLEDKRLREGWIDKAELGPDKRDVTRPAGRSALAKKWAPAILEALKRDTTAPLHRIGTAPETVEEDEVGG